MKSHIFLASTIFLMIGCGGGPKRPPIQAIPPDAPATIKANIDIYVENSVSMDGYVNGAVTDFKNAVFSYLSVVKNADITDSLNLNYINSKSIPYDSNIEDFIQRLDPDNFRTRGGDRGSTDIDNIINMVLQKTSNKNISILVSDLIFSPGKGKNAEQYLLNQQLGIFNKMVPHLKKYPNHAIIIYHLESSFDGTYFNRTDTRQYYKGQTGVANLART